MRLGLLAVRRLAVLDELPFATGRIPLVHSVLSPVPPGMVSCDFTTDERSVYVGGRTDPEATIPAPLRFLDQGQCETVE